MLERPPAPSGLVYQPDLITQTEEQQVLGLLEAMEFHPVTMHGHTARRTVRHFGLDYGYGSWKLVPTEPLPRSSAGLQERAAALAGLDPEEFAQFLVSRYPPGPPGSPGSTPSGHQGPALLEHLPDPQDISHGDIRPAALMA
jgi:hypothetical protein